MTMIGMQKATLMVLCYTPHLLRRSWFALKTRELLTIKVVIWRIVHVSYHGTHQLLSQAVLSSNLTCHSIVHDDYHSIWVPTTRSLR